MLTDKIIKAVHEDIPKINSQLEEKAKQVDLEQVTFIAENFRTTGMNDDDLLTALLNLDTTKKTKILFDKNRTYNLTKYFYLKSNMTLDFNHCDITFNTSDSPLDKTGIFNITSEYTKYTEGILSFDLYYKNVTSVNSVFDTVTKLDLTPEIYNSININGLIGLVIIPKNPPYTSTETIPLVETVARVIDKLDNNCILVDYTSPYDWNQYETFARKEIYVFNNVKENIEIINIGTFDIQCGKKSIAPFFIHGCDSYRIENIRKIQGHTLPAIFSVMAYKPVIENVFAQLPTSVDAGLGYCMQIIQCNGLYANNITGRELRHLIDITGGCNHVIENSRMPVYSFTPSVFDCHGVGEHNITYKSCMGSWCFGNGRNQFPSNSANISLYDCTIKGIIGDCDNNVTITTSELFICNDATTIRFRKFTVRDSKIYFNANYNGQLRGIHLNKDKLNNNIIFDNCDFILPSKTIDVTQNISLILQYWNTIKFINCHMADIRLKIIVTNSNATSFQNCNLGETYLEIGSHLSMENCRTISENGYFTIKYKKPTKYLKHVFKNNYFKLLGGTNFYMITDSTLEATYKHIIELYGNHIDVIDSGSTILNYSFASRGENIVYMYGQTINTISGGTIVGLYNSSLNDKFTNI